MQKVEPATAGIDGPCVAGEGEGPVHRSFERALGERPAEKLVDPLLCPCRALEVPAGRRGDGTEPEQELAEKIRERRAPRALVSFC